MKCVTLSILMVLILTLLSNGIDGQEECPKNQNWNDCGSACPGTCTDPSPEICTLQCVIGCQCKPGYLLNEAGNCVEPEDC